MMRIVELVNEHRRQYLVYFALSLVVLGFVGIIYGSDRTVFVRFLGGVNPLLAFLAAGIIGFFVLSYFLYGKWFAIYEKENRRGLAYVASIAAILGIIMMFVDTRIVFSPYINVLFPTSLLFYPAMGFFAEIVFHVLPVGIILFLLSTVLKNSDQAHLTWLAVVVVSFLEPVYQSINMTSSGQFSLLAVLYISFHIFIINFCQLAIFRRYDFITMYTFRLVYYLFWHIVWGYLRLEILF